MPRAISQPSQAARPSVRAAVLRALVLTAMLGQACLAQQGSATGELYRIGKYDTLEYAVAEDPSSELVTLLVGPDGCVQVAYVGTVRAEGKTCDELAGEIREALVRARRFVSPTVLVRVKTLGSQQVSVLGAVLAAGSFPHQVGMTVREAVAQAGGVDFKIATNPQAVLVRRDGPTLRFALDQALSATGEYASLELRPGDALIIEQSVPVSVFGYVKQPGFVYVQQGATLTQVLGAVGGSSDVAEQFGTVTINRAGGGVEEVDIASVIEGRGGHDPEIHPGDVVYVARTERQVVLSGYVREPLRYSFDPGERVSSLIARAGGVLMVTQPVTGTAWPAGDLRRVQLIRADGTVLIVNQEAVLAGQGTAEDDPVLQPGDTVVVPELQLEISVLGHVVQPGRYRVRPGDRVSDALAMAGGPIRPTEVVAQTTGADLAGALLCRSDGSVLPVDLSLVLTDPARSDNVTVDPGDTLIIPESRNRVAVSGYVQQPGFYEFRPGDTVGDMVATAGGATVGVGDPSRVVVRHADGSEDVVDLTSGDIAVRPGDVVSVPFGSFRVAVFGYVKSPGSYPWHEGDTVRDILALADGISEGYGDAAHVVVRRRDGTEQTIDVRVEDAAVRPGDEIRVPFGRLRVAVLGYVNDPGFYQWHEGDTVVQMIAAAGGVYIGNRERAGDRHHVVLIRRSEGEDAFRVLDLSKFYDHGDQSVNVAVEPDDIVLVPRSDHTNYSGWLTNIRDALSIANIMRLLF